MAEETSVADPIVGVEGDNTLVQDTLETAPAASEPQSTNATQVEGGDNKPQTQEPPKPQYEGLMRAERKRIRRLEETINQLQKRLEQPSPKSDGLKNEPLDHTLINQDVDKYLTLREQRTLQPYEQRILALERRWEDKVVQEENQKSLGALEKLYPKSSPDSNETLEERVNRDPEYSERLKEFFNTPAMKAMSVADPDGAVEYAIYKLGIKPPVNPTVIKKSAMGGTGSGNPGMGNKTSVSESDLLSELKKLNTQLGINPELRKDEKFLKRKADVMQQLERLVTRKKG